MLPKHGDEVERDDGVLRLNYTDHYVRQENQWRCDGQINYLPQAHDDGKSSHG